MAVALVVQHVAHEDPGRLADWLPAYGVELDVRHPYAAVPLPSTVDADALIVMGGPMGANDDDVVSWLPATKALLADAVARGVPTLGVCLGAQLLAVATGGRVERGAHGPEIGLGEVSGDGRDSLLVGGTFPVVQWHYDTVTELPDGATLLASSERYPVQAFRVGKAAWGLQFHVEAAPALVASWAAAEDRDVEEIVAPVRSADRVIARVGEELSKRFAAVVNRGSVTG